jgi:predicted DNA-binding ribbon-helix-helix protein
MIGRPYDPLALRRTGKRINVILNQSDFKWLLELAKEHDLTISDLLRILIRERNKKNECT